MILRFVGLEAVFCRGMAGFGTEWSFFSSTSGGVIAIGILTTIWILS